MTAEGIRREDWAAAVTTFTQLHESHALDPSQKRYRELIPAPPETVFQMMKEIFRGQACDITGIRDYQMLEERGGIFIRMPWKEQRP